MPENKTQEPIIKLDVSGEASIISYNVPEPTSYKGKNIMELDFEKIEWTDAALKKPDRVPTGKESEDKAEAAVDEIIHTGVVAMDIFPNIEISIDSKPRILDPILNPEEPDENPDAI